MSIDKKILCPEFTQTERMFLASMTHHDGFPLLKRMVDEAVKKSQAEVMLVDPSDANYEVKLKAAQLNARAINEFATALIMSFNAHVANGINELELETAKEEKRRSPN